MVGSSCLRPPILTLLTAVWQQSFTEGALSSGFGMDGVNASAPWRSRSGPFRGVRFPAERQGQQLTPIRRGQVGEQIP
ncbi:MAG: hypothetical protein ACK4TR_14430 [Phenylobacterium sp.]|uniref:hypothetical protein n=1 Tax=Phenylobacterium sp. TaxID=1871053 RepID=UPI003919502F